MITAASLKSRTSKDLSEMAKRKGISGWHAMRKDELVKALVKDARAAERKKAARATKKSAPAKSAKAKASPKSSPKAKSETARPKRAKAAPKKKVSARTIRKIQKAHELRGQKRDLATESGSAKKKPRDRCVLLVRDSYWLQAYWEITRETVERAKVALAEHWHTAEPVLRVAEIDDTSTTSTAERVIREIPIHGGVNNWYIDVAEPPKTFRVTLGYKTGNKKFHVLGRSNKVSTPVPGGADVDGNWADIAENCEKIFAMSGGYNSDNGNGELKELFEERLRRPMGSPATTQYGAGADTGLSRPRQFEFNVDAEMVIFGSADASAYVTLAGEPVKLRSDGSFTVRLPLPDRRQVLPIVASSADGVEQRTTVLAVERNTKVMEPLIKQNGDD